MPIVEAHEIEKTLASLSEGLSSQGKMRASLFNLIIYSHKDGREEYLRALSRKIIEKFPARIIFLQIDEKKTTPLSITVSTISPSDPPSEIVCDLIELTAAPFDEEKIVFLVTPLFEADLPIILLYADDPCKNDLLAQKLEKLASRIIFDSESTANLSCYATTLLDHLQRSKTAIGDLNWARSEGWRLLLNELFPTAEKAKELESTSKIILYYNSIEKAEYLTHVRTQSVYLQAWIATCLCWKLQGIKRLEDGKTLFLFAKPEGTVEISLNPVSYPSLPAGRIVSLQFEFSSGSQILLDRRIDSPYQVVIHESGPTSCSMPAYFVFDKDEIGRSLIQEVCQKTMSEHFLSVLQLISKHDEFGVC